MAERKNRSKSTVGVRFDPETLKKIDEQAEERSLNRSDFIREVLDQYAQGQLLFVPTHLTQMMDSGPWFEKEEVVEFSTIQDRRLEVIRRALMKTNTAKLTDIQERREAQAQLSQAQTQVAEMTEAAQSRDKVIRGLMMALKEFEF